jgi:sn-glycerol 3-phosphate transport system permease protein
MFIPIEIVMVSTYLLIAHWGLLNTHAGVILPQLAHGFGNFLLRQQLRDLASRSGRALRWTDR